MGISFLLMGVVFVILLAVSDSLDQTANIARSNQVFFAAESGMESAFFHHNARGAGVNFQKDSDGNLSDEQVIMHDEVGASVGWTIEGRAQNLYGLLKEDQTVQIPFFWDNSETPQEVPPFDARGNLILEQSNAGSLAEAGFSLQFYELIGENASEGTPERALFDRFGEVDLTGFDYGNTLEEILIDWKVSRKNDGRIQTFLPQDRGGCGGETEFICEGELTIPLSSSNPIVGKVLPCLERGPTACQTRLSEFLSRGTNFQLTFRPLLGFTSSTGTKIPGIPYVFDPNSDQSVPKETYGISSKVTIGSFSQRIDLEVPEKTTIGSFNYVIFD